MSVLQIAILGIYYGKEGIGTGRLGGGHHGVERYHQRYFETPVARLPSHFDRKRAAQLCLGE